VCHGSDRRGTRWELLFDRAVESAANRNVPQTQALIKRVRAWQHRQTRNDLANHLWHDCELLWLEGVVLEHAGRTAQARRIFLRLARVFATSLRDNQTWSLPLCPRCAKRTLGFARTWFDVASAVRTLPTEDVTADVLRAYAKGTEDAEC
jgi:hypothetical protein